MTLDPVKLSEKSQLSAATLAAGDRFVALDVSAGQLVTVPKSELEAAIGSPTVTADRALVSDGSGNLAASAVTATELGRLSGVTSAVQTQLDGKQAAGSYAAATHTHAISDTTGLQTALDGKQAAGSYAAATHSHAIADVANLQTTLDGKASTGSVAAVSAALAGAEADIDTLETSVAGKQASNANLTALAGLTGAADRVPYFTALATLALATLTSFGRSIMAAADAAGVRSLLGLGTAAQSNTGDFAASTHTHAQSDVADLTTDLAAKATLTAVPILAPATANRNKIQPASNDAKALQLQEKSGGSDVVLEILDSAGNVRGGFSMIGYTLEVGNVAISGAGSTITLGGGGDIRASSFAQFTITNAKLRAPNNSPNVALEYSSAGVYEINNGTAGEFRDLAARHLLSSDFLRLANPVTNLSHTTFEALTGLSQTLTAGKTYAGRLVLIASCPTPGDGVRVDFDDGTATFYNAHAALTGNVQGATVDTSRYAGAGSAIQCSALADDGRHYLVFDVTVSVNAGGTFVPRFSKSSDAAGDNLTIHDGSYFDLREVR